MDEMPATYIRCGAVTSSGRPCRRAAIRGGTRCTLHGGASPQARQKAEEVLAVARVPAAGVLLRIIHDWQGSACPACGRPSADPGPVIRAAIAVLDRTGLHPSLAVRVGPAAESATDPAIEWLTAPQARAMASIFEDCRRRMLAGEPKPEWSGSDLDQPRVPPLRLVDPAPVGTDAASAHSPWGTNRIIDNPIPTNTLQEPCVEDPRQHIVRPSPSPPK